MESNLAKQPKTVNQSFSIHRFRPENYELIAKWWRRRNFPVPAFEHIPPTGYIVSFGSTQICAGFLCKTDSNVAVIWHLASNPDCDKQMRQESIDFLIYFMCEQAKSEHFSLVCLSTNIPKLGKRVVERNKFIKFDENVTVFGKVL